MSEHKIDSTRRSRRPVAIDAPREFAAHELFFSITTPKGLIESGNDVFIRVSGYVDQEMLGEPHNIIRHPDMPRAVFGVFWDYLKAGRAIAAYVKNMAKDGRHYWVVALAAPIDGGYVSVRFKPSSSLFPSIEQVYRDVSAAEQACQQRGANAKEIVAAGESRLLECLAARGFADYDAFMRTALYEELKSRDAVLASQRRTVFKELPPRRADESALAGAVRTAHAEALQFYGQLASLYAQLDEAVSVNARISQQANEILRATGAFQLVAFNIAIRSSRLQEAGLALGVIATNLREASVGVGQIVSDLTKQARTVSSSLGEAVFSIAWTRLQYEMAAVYYEELLAHDGDDSGADWRLNIEALRYALGQTIERARVALQSLATDLKGLTGNTESLRRAMLSLEVVYIGGLVESRRLSGDDSFSAFFEDVRQRIDGTREQLLSFADVIHDLGHLASEAPRIIQTVSKAAERLAQDQRAFAAAASSTAERPAA